MRIAYHIQIFLTFVTMAWVHAFSNGCKVIAQCSAIEISAVNESEQKIAKKFHAMINAYRIENRIHPLKWNDTLCAAASNHSRWMAVNDELDHVEHIRGEYYTGREVTDRITYAYNRSGENYCGENCLYFTYDMDTTCVIADSVAEDIAREAFLIWRDSPGHNSNMLHPFSMHGVGFCYRAGVIWSTDVFFWRADRQNSKDTQRRPRLWITRLFIKN